MMSTVYSYGLFSGRLTPSFNPPKVIISNAPSGLSEFALQLLCMSAESSSSAPITKARLASVATNDSGSRRKRASNEFSLFDGQITVGRDAPLRPASESMSVPAHRKAPTPTFQAQQASALTRTTISSPAETQSGETDTRLTLKELMSAAGPGRASRAAGIAGKKAVGRPPVAAAVAIRREPATAANTKPTDSGPAKAIDKDTAAASRRPTALGPTVSKGEFVRTDFDLLGEVCRNIAASEVSVEYFRKKFGLVAADVAEVEASCDVVVSVLWEDLSTNHLVAACAGVEQVRSLTMHRDRRALIGLLVLLGNEPHVAYLLPLARCMGDKLGAGGAAGEGPLLPLQCGVPLAQRWQLATDILFERSSPRPQSQAPPRLKIVHNIQLTMLSLLSYCDSSGASDRLVAYTPGDFAGLLNPRGASYEELLQAQLKASGAGGSTSPHKFLPIDPKIVGFICDDSNSNKETVPLELADLFARFQVSPPDQLALDRLGQGRVTRAIRGTLAEMVSLLELGRQLHGRLRLNLALYRFYALVELPLLELLSCMEYGGIPVDRTYLANCEGDLKAAMETVTAYAKECVSISTGQTHAFNIASPEQVSHILYTVLKVQPPASASAGNKAKKFISTAEEDLQQIAGAHPLVGYVLQYRALAKVVHTYIEGYYPFIVSTTDSSTSAATSGIERFFGSSGTDSGAKVSRAQPFLHPQHRLHPQWNITSVRTGRLSCSRPNLQSLPNAQVLKLQAPTGGESGSHQSHPDQIVEINLRRCVITSPAPAGSRGRSVLVSADYSQIEMRLLAHISNDQAMIQLFNAGSEAGAGGVGNDIYRQLAVAILGLGQGDRQHFGAVDPVAAANVTDAQRSQAKVVTLGVMYGMGPQAAAQKLNISVPAVKTITAQFFQKFCGVRDWMAAVKRHLPDINGQAGGGATYGAVAAAERQAINTVIQGSASELIKTAMALIQSHINEYPYWSGSDDSTAQPTARLVPTLLMQIHDELVYEVPLPSLSGDEAADALADQAAVCAFVSLLRESMERKVGALFELKVPLTVNIQTSTHSWGLFQKLKL